MMKGLIMLQFVLSVYAFAPGVVMRRKRDVISEIWIGFDYTIARSSRIFGFVSPIKRRGTGQIALSAKNHLESIERWYKNSQSGPGTLSYLDTLPSNFGAGALEESVTQTDRRNNTISAPYLRKPQLQATSSNWWKSVPQKTNFGETHEGGKASWGDISYEGYKDEIMEADSIVAAALQSINNVNMALSATQSPTVAEKLFSDVISTTQQPERASVSQQEYGLDTPVRNDELALLNAEKIELENSVAELRVAQKQWESTVTELRGQKSSLESAMSQLGIEKKELDALAYDLNQQLKQACEIQNQQRLDAEARNEQLTTLNAEKQQLESTVTELQATQSEWKATVEELKYQKSYLESTTSQLEIEKQQLHSMSEDFRQALERACAAQNEQSLDTKMKDEQLRALSATKLQLEKEVKKLRSKEAEWEATVTKLQNEKSALKSSTVRIEMEKKELDSTAKDLQQQLEQAYSSLNQNRLDNKEKADQLDSVNENTAHLQTTIKELQTSKNDWESQIAELQKRNIFLESTASQLGTEKHQLASSAEDARRQLEQAYTAREKQDKEIEEISKQLKALNMEKLELKGVVTQLQTTQNEWEDIVNELRNQKEHMEQKTTQLESEKEKLESRAADVFQQLERAKSAQHKQELEAKSKDEQIAFLNVEKRELEETIAYLKATENEWETTVMELREQKSCLESSACQLEAEKQELKTILEEFRNQLEQAHCAQNQHKQDTEEKNEQLHNLNKNKIQLEKTIDELRVAQSKWETTVTELQNQKSTLESAILKLEAEKRELENIANDLRQQLQRAYSIQQQQELNAKKKDEQLEILNTEKLQLQNKVTELERTQNRLETTVAELHDHKGRLETTTLHLEAEKQQLDAIAMDLRQQVNLWKSAAKEEEEKNSALSKEKNQLREFVSSSLGSQDSLQGFDERDKLENKISILKKEKEELETNAKKMEDSENVLTEELKILRQQLKLQAETGPQGPVESHFPKSPEITVQGDSLKTWSFASPAVEQVEVLLKTEGRPLDADVELWAGPDNIPQRIRVYVENGSTRPFRTLLRTPRSPNTVAVRNIGQVELPLAAQIDAVSSSKPSGLDIIDLPTDSMGSPVIIQGGALRTFPFGSEVESVQVLLKTDGRPLNAKVELLQGPNNSKQVMQIYTEDGLERPFYAIINTPGSGNIIWIMNTATVEFPMTASLAPYEVSNKPSFEDMEPVINGFGGLAGR